MMSLLFNILSRFVCHSFSSKEQASFNFMAVVTICSDFEPKKIKSITVSIVSPSICHEVMEKKMATHSSILGWRIPWTEESGGLQFMRSQELDTT